MAEGSSALLTLSTLADKAKDVASDSIFLHSVPSYHLIVPSIAITNPSSNVPSTVTSPISVSLLIPKILVLLHIKVPLLIEPPLNKRVTDSGNVSRLPLRSKLYLISYIVLASLILSCSNTLIPPTQFLLSII